MKQDIKTFLIDSFVDFKGVEHKFVACALSESPLGENQTLKIGWVDDDTTHIDANQELYHDVYRLVTIGIAVCNPEDAFNEEIGKQIAYNKAASDESLPRLYSTCKGIITKELVDAFLQQQVKFFKENPEMYIKGYREAQKAYQEIQTAKNEIENLSKEEKAVFDLAIKGFNVEKCLNLAKFYVNKILGTK